MRVAYVITRSDVYGGASSHVRELASGMMGQGHDVVVLIGGDGIVFKALLRGGVPVHGLRHLRRAVSPLNDMLAIHEIRSELRSFNPDVVALHSSKAGWLGRLACASLGLPAVFTVHGWAFAAGTGIVGTRFFKQVERLAARFARRIILVSWRDFDLAVRNRIAAPERLAVVHSGVCDVPREFRANPRGDPPRVVMVARFDAPKDQQGLLRALAALRGLPWSVEFVGDGPRLGGTKALASSLNLEGRVRFLGERPNVTEILATAQIFVLTSGWESFPLTILEAMRGGLPVIASNVGGVEEAVAHRVTGLVVPAGDAAALRDGLQRVLANPGLRAAMGAAGRERYEKEFTSSTMLERTLSVYKDALEASGGPRSPKGNC
jgi:glycosyltransferase involved in cell wall biosynthesis